MTDDDQVMTSQGWIFDPPPPPPPKRTEVDVNSHAQRQPTTGRGGGPFRGNPRGGHVGRGRHIFNGSRRGHQQTTTTPAQSYTPQGAAYTTTAYSMPLAAYPQGQAMYPSQGWPQEYTPHYQPYSIQQYSQPAPLPNQSQLVKAPVQIHNPDHWGRRLPVYSTQSPPMPGPKPAKPKRNELGYSMSSTAYSLPEHHSIPVPSGSSEMSEEELRFALEMQMKEKISAYIDRRHTADVVHLSRGRISY